MGDPAYKIYSLKDYLITYESPHFFLCRVRIDVLVIGQFAVFALDLKKKVYGNACLRKMLIHLFSSFLSVDL